MFGFKKPKGRRNIRKKQEGAVEEAASQDEPTGIVKRTSKLSSKVDAVSTASSPGLSFGSEQGSEFIKVRKSRPSARIKEIISEQSTRDAEERKYTDDDIQALKDESAKPTSDTYLPPEAAASRYPFSNEGLPDAQEIYMAKKLRRQRQAAQRMEDAEDGVNSGAMRNEDDFVSLADGLASSTIGSTKLDDLLDDGATEGEDEGDVVIIGKNEREEYSRSSRIAKEESIMHAQEEGEASDWENEQLRNAGVASANPHLDKRGVQRPVDSGGFEFDSSYLGFLIAQEKNQLALEKNRLMAVQNDIEHTNAALKAIQEEAEVAQKQWEHFTAITKAT
ncbi:hypothetical protein GQ54DRAFT_316080 [Martensiomyces pterosporus]|nr:hypothetical protein GQ54DRAFT_316080 [Martensiomyces pterosporus]